MPGFENGVLFRSEILSKPREGLGLTQEAIIFDEKEYHSIATKVYEIRTHFNFSPDYRLSPEEENMLLALRNRIPKMKEEEKGKIAERLAILRASGKSQEDVALEERKLKKEEEVFLNIQDALKRHIDHLFRDSAQRAKATSIKEESKPEEAVEKKEEKFEPSEYRKELESKIQKYGDLVKKATKVFGRTEVILSDGYNTAFPKQIEQDIFLLQSARLELENEQINVAGDEKKVAQIRDFILPGLTVLEKKLEEKRIERLRETNKSTLNNWLNNLKQRTQFESLVDGRTKLERSTTSVYADLLNLYLDLTKHQLGFEALRASELARFTDVAVRAEAAKAFDEEARLTEELRKKTSKRLLELWLDSSLEFNQLKAAITDAESPGSDVAPIEEQERVLADAVNKIGSVSSWTSGLLPELREDAKKELDEKMASVERVRKQLTEAKNSRVKEVGVEKKQALLKLITDILKLPKAEELGRTLSKPELEAKDRDLDAAQTAAREAGYTLSSAGEADDFKDAKKKITEAIAVAEKLDPDFREVLWGRIQQRLDLTTALKNDEDRNAILASIDLLPEPRRSEEKKRWKMHFEMWNGYLKGSISNDSELRLLWVDARASREAIKPYCKLETVRDFIHLPTVRPIVELLESYYKEPQEYIHTGYNPKTGNYDATEEDDKGIKRPLKGQKKKHDYASYGDPEPDQALQGVPKVSDRLKTDVSLGKAGAHLKDTKDSVLSGIHHAQMIGELRFKYFARRFANYLASPQNFKVEPITEVNPLAGILYTLRSKGKIAPDTLLMWQVLRLPGDRHGIYVKLGTNPKTNRDGSKEYLPDDAPSLGGGEYSKRNPELAVRNDSVEKAMELRTFLDQQLTFYDDEFEGVAVSEDLNILPYMWDVVSTKKYTGLTYETYIAMCTMWNDFVYAASKPVSLHESSDVAKSIKNVAGKLATFKDGYNRLSGDEKGRIRAISTQIFLRYTKALFDEYNGKVRGGLGAAIEGITSKEGATIKERFLNKAIGAYEGMQTVPGDIREVIIQKLITYKSKPFSEDLFAERKGHPLPVQVGPFKSAERIRREEIIGSMLEGMSESEKKDTK